MSNGFLRFLVQIARDWTDFWGFDGISGVYLTFLGVMNGERKLRRRMATWRSLLLLATLQNVLLRVLKHFLDRKGYLEVRLWHKGTRAALWSNWGSGGGLWAHCVLRGVQFSVLKGGMLSLLSDKIQHL